MISRRGLLTGAGFGAAGLAVGVGTTALVASSDDGDTVPFDGEHQAGITTRPQDALHFAAFDVVTNDRAELADLLKQWTTMARHMTSGEPSEQPTSEHSVPEDTGEVSDLSAANLTVTAGFGPSLFDDRFGLSAQRPAELQDLPHFPGDQLIPELCGGDLCIQACSDNPQVAIHAVRNLARVGAGVVSVRWAQMGFGHASATTRGQQTPRNLFGFKDGTNNLRSEDNQLVDDHVWVSGTGTWLDGGAFLIPRRIRMLIENWDRQVLTEQESTFGRQKASGAPLGRTDEFDPLPLDEYVGTSGPLIPASAHARLASPEENNGARMLRRAYNFTTGTDGLGHLDAGLFFIAVVNSPETSFIPIQNKLAHKDKMNEYVRYESSSIFALPPGVRGADDWWGRTLFEA